MKPNKNNRKARALRLSLLNLIFASAKIYLSLVTNHWPLATSAKPTYINRNS